MPRNLLKIPSVIFDRLKSFDQDDVVAATVKQLRPEDVATYAHLGLALNAGTLETPPPAVPKPTAGKFSKANLVGMEKVRKDLPKYGKDFIFLAESWGSGSYHLVTQTRQVYPRDFYPPKQVNLTVDLLEKRGSVFIVKFTIDQVINRRTPNFPQELLYNLNLLQENVGAADVFPSAATLVEYAATVHVDWQLLPPGSVDEVLQAMLAGRKPVSAAEHGVMKDRITVMSQLRPEAFVTGTDGFQRYFGAKFGDDFVVFENLRYGNAMYVMFEDWQALSQKSRVELLAGDPASFERIIHQPGWIDKLKAELAAYRKRKRREQRLL
ncbi:MAG: hypothetical protein Q8R82_20435 [Hyphomonadaceae bacterium]|nr:hypothetical protein [Hyphomonadaceae bacterium]